MKLLTKVQVGSATRELLLRSKKPPNVDKCQTEASKESDFCESKERHRAVLRCLTIWWLEILSVTFSLICLLILVAVLAVIDAKPYETFRLSNLDITPNTFVSIIATVGKSCFLFAVAESLSQMKWQHFREGPRRLIDLQKFDEASRGRLGSLKLLCSLKFRSLVASFGAILVVLAIASEPFTQQLLSYPVLMHNASNQTAFIGAARALDSGGHGLYAHRTKSYGQKINRAMSSAAFGSPEQVKFDCSSGHCTWPEFDTLGVCMDCQDISNQLKINCQNNGTLCTYEPPADWQQTKLQAWALWVYTVDSTTPRHPWVPTTRLNISAQVTESPFLVDKDGFLGMITAFRFPLSVQGSPQDVVPEATRCRLRFCVKTYSASRIVDGTLKEPVASSTQVRVQNSACNSNYGEAPPLCPITKARDGLTQSNHAQVERFWFNQVDLGWMQSHFLALFESVKVLYPQYLWVNNGSLEQHPSLNPYKLSQLPKDFKDELVASNAFDSWTSAGPDDLASELVYQWPRNLSRVFENVGISLSNQLRNDANATQVQGKVIVPIVYIHVKWPWLIYLASLSVLATLLLGLCIWVSKEEDRPVWKSSILPLLFLGLGSEHEGAQDATREKLEQKSKRIRVQLLQDDSGQFTLCEDYPVTSGQ